MNTTDILDVIEDKVDKGIDFVDTEGLLQTLADISAAFESVVFNCSADEVGDYSDDCVELAELGIELIKAIVTMGEPEPEFCNDIISNAVIFLEMDIMPSLNSTDLILISAALADCITGTEHEDFANMEPSFDFFVYANDVIQTIKDTRNESSPNALTSYPVFENVISVAQHAYDVLALGETMLGCVSLSLMRKWSR